MNKAKTTVYKSGNSQAITLQKSILREAEVNIGDEMYCYVDENKRIILEKSNQSFKSRWENFVKEGGTYEEEEVDLGKPEGRELW